VTDEPESTSRLGGVRLEEMVLIEETARGSHEKMIISMTSMVSLAPCAVHLEPLEKMTETSDP